MKNMLNFKEFTADELMDILNLALDMKKNPEKYSEPFFHLQPALPS